MAEKFKKIYVCRVCGYETGKWLGRCPSCENYNTMEETDIQTPIVCQTAPHHQTIKPQTLNSIASLADSRIATKMSELDNVLSGGLVEGSVVLLGGAPGIGKSTLLLQICQNIGQDKNKILYVSGEESLQQIKMRADRLGITTEKLLLLSETQLENILPSLRELSPTIAIIDSIQTLVSDQAAAAPGSVSQIRLCTMALTRLAKAENISVLIVGHITKEGAIAGPKILEHMVDTVLYFEGEQRESYRLIRAVKNRFGSTNEIGLFEMRDSGLHPIENPSAYMLSGRPLEAPGSVVTCGVEGTRPILTEVQALLSPTNFGMPRRSATGADPNRVTMLLAVLEKRVGLKLSGFDSYINIAGGLKIIEPSLDAAVVVAAASSYQGRAVDSHTMVFGEVGLAGELRAVHRAEKRIFEAYRQGFTLCVIPQANLHGLKKPNGCRVLGAAHINELLEVCLRRE
jgi:DNA repair protein RadA/Sms